MQYINTITGNHHKMTHEPPRQQFQTLIVEIYFQKDNMGILKSTGACGEHEMQEEFASYNSYLRKQEKGPILAEDLVSFYE